MLVDRHRKPRKNKPLASRVNVRRQPLQNVKLLKNQNVLQTCRQRTIDGGCSDAQIDTVFDLENAIRGR